MLVPSMNFNEIQVEANLEYQILCKSSTLERLTYEYGQERSRLKIKPHERHVKIFKIKTKRKNTWLIMLHPKEECKFVTSIHDFTALCILYYHSDKGLRAIVTSPTKIIAVYNEHLFSRYKERLGLEIADTLEVVKNYFVKNHHTTFQTMPIDEQKVRKIIGILVNGFALGELIIGKDDTIILNYKTFISRETANFKHAKSLFEIEKIYKNNKDQDSNLLYEILGFNSEKEDNSQFFKQWEDLREKVNSNENQVDYYKVVTDGEIEKS